MNIEDLFFQLLQVAIGTRKTLDRQPTSKEWALLFDMSKKQALTSIAFAGVTRLNKASDFGASLGIPAIIYLKWLGLVEKINQRNGETNKVCEEVCKRLAHDGLVSCILKGQSNLVYYPEELQGKRTPGDIDIWVWPAEPCGLELAVGDLDGKGAHYEAYHGNRAVIEYVKMLHRLAGTEPQDGVRYHHIEAPDVDGIEVEVHFRPLFFDSPLRNWRVQKWFCLNEQFGLNNAKIDNAIFPVPTVSFNAVYQLCHIYRHLFDEGIGLRQLLDYYFVLRALHIEQETLSGSPLKGERPDHWTSMAQWAEGMGIAVKSNQEIMHQLKRFGMAKFAAATMWVLKEVYAMPEEYCLCEANVREGRFLLSEIMQAGNFGMYDERIKHETPSIPLLRGKKVPGQLWHAWEKLKHNMRLVRHYPEEVLCEPFFRLYHWVWRKLELWRY